MALKTEIVFLIVYFMKFKSLVYLFKAYFWQPSWLYSYTLAYHCCKGLSLFQSPTGPFEITILIFYSNRFMGTFITVTYQMLRIKRCLTSCNGATT